MRAAVLNQIGGAFAIEELADPTPQAGEVLIRVAACGVCHSDLHVVHGNVTFPAPCVLGHEVSGIVEAVGAGPSTFTVGQRVAGTFIMPCGSCRHCRRGHDELCETFFVHNRLQGHLYDGTSRLKRLDGSKIAQYSMGGLAELCVMPERGVHALPDNVNLDVAAILGCSGFTAMGAVSTTGHLQIGESVAVIGCGGVGSSIIQVAHAMGASQIFAVDVSDEKLAAAQALGATHLVNSRNVNPVEFIRDSTNGRGVDVVFEALGRPETVEAGIMMLDDMGRLVMVGLAPKDITANIPILHVVRRKIQILGSYGARASSDMETLIGLMNRGLFDPAKVVTNRYNLADVNTAYADLEAGKIVGRGLVLPGTLNQSGAKAS
jgi:S-(hydroxymethyl)glutathione dehydrogenase/alcohol dehydrogenase